jgi:hypothetical protein
MAICPDGHDSASGDVCDVCGYRFGTAQPPWAPATPAPPPPASDSSFSSPPTPAPWPPLPPAPRPISQPPPWAPAAQYSPPPPTHPQAQHPQAQHPQAERAQAPPARHASARHAPSGWMAVVSCDRAYYEAVRAANAHDRAAVSFPSHYAERRFALAGHQMQIGRRSISRGIEPEIDLTGPPADPGVSRLHAVLLATADGGWAVLDPGSANGTLVNGAEIPTGVQVPLSDGDRINLGGWTAITVHRG